MFRQVIAVVAVLAAVPAFAQERYYGDWVYSYNEDDFSGERTDSASAKGDDVGIVIGCLTSGSIALMFISLDGIFHDGEIDLRWMNGPKDGEIESYRMEDENEYIAMNSGDDRNDVLGIIDSLRSHSELRLRFRRWRDERVTDRISLNGSTSAINTLPCVNP